MCSYEEYLVLKNFSEATIRSYLQGLKSFLEYRKAQGFRGRMGQHQARLYILYRKEQGVMWSTINCDYSALRKYFKEVLGLKWSFKKLPRPRKERYLPRIISRKEVVNLIESGKMFKHQVFFTLLYGTGLRLGEALNLKIEDIDGHRLEIRVNKGKGAKDRIVRIPVCLLDLLRVYFKRYRPEVYLFNGRKKGHKMSPRAVQWAFKHAKTEAKITKKLSSHTLRHCFATHHLEDGTNLVFVQEQLGHKHIKTTTKYIHLCQEHYRHISHPLAKLTIRYR